MLFMNTHDTDRVDRRMIDMFLVRKKMIGSVYGVQFRRGLGKDMSDYHE